MKKIVNIILRVFISAVINKDNSTIQELFLGKIFLIFFIFSHVKKIVLIKIDIHKF